MKIYSVVFGLILVSAMFSHTESASTQYYIAQTPCRVLSASDYILTCGALGDHQIGDIFSFQYTNRTAARTYPRSGRNIIVYYYVGRYRPHVLTDWFLYRTNNRYLYGVR